MDRGVFDVGRTDIPVCLFLFDSAQQDFLVVSRETDRL